MIILGEFGEGRNTFVFCKFCSKGPPLSLLFNVWTHVHICYQNLGLSVYWCWIKSQKQSLGGAERDSFITLQAKGDAPGFCLKKKLCASTPVNLIMVYSSGSKVGSLIRLGYKEVLHSPSLFSGGLYPNLNELLSPLSSFIRWFLGCFSLDQQLFTSALWNSGKSHNGWNLTYKKWGTARPPCLCGTPQSPTQFHIWV